MSIQRYTNRSTPDGVWLDKTDDGEWMLYADHRAELERVAREVLHDAITAATFDGLGSVDADAIVRRVMEGEK